MSDEISIGRTIGRYRVLEEIGRGAMGIVYRALDPVIGRTVALKTIAFAENDEQSRMLRTRLFREASAAGTLAHPNIVTIYDIIDDGAVTAVAMEYVEGQPLSAVIGRGRTLPVGPALALFEQICAALDFAGSRGIVHRDIKPANILLTPDGRAKILDFGIARLSLAGITQTKTIMGSPSYMSPEQVQGLRLDPRSDLFSAAVVLYEMLTGERAFAGDDAATTMYKIVHESPRPVEHLNPSLSPAISDVLACALAKAPTQRFQSGRDLVAALRSVLEAPSVEVFGEPAPAPALAPAPGRSPLLLYGAIASGVMVVAIAVAIVVVSQGTDSMGRGAGPPIGGGAPVMTVVPGPTPQVATRAVPPAGPPAGPMVPSPDGEAGAETAVPTQSSQATADPRARSSEPPSVATSSATERAGSTPAPKPVDTAPAAPVADAGPPETPPAPALPADVSVTYAGAPYPVTFLANGRQVGRISSPRQDLSLEAGRTRLRMVNESIYLDQDFGTVTLRAGQRRSFEAPATVSAYVGVRGDRYAGLQILIDGQTVPGPYPAQLARIVRGSHRVEFRWTSGALLGVEIRQSVTLSGGSHFRIQAMPEDANIAVQRLR